MYRNISRIVYNWIEEQKREGIETGTFVLDRLQISLQVASPYIQATATLGSYDPVEGRFYLNDLAAQKEFSESVNTLFNQKHKDDSDYRLQTYLQEYWMASVSNSGKQFEITLSNGSVIIVEREAVNLDTGTVWDWKVDSQFFSDGNYARMYLNRLIAEKLTGKRVIYRGKKPVPEICGIEGAACRSPGACNTMLCSNCPVAEKFFADRDGVELVYVI